MRRRSTIGFAGLFLAATILVAGGGTATGGRMDLETMQEIAARYTAAWCSQDPASVAAFFAADGSLRINEGEPAVGREAITASAAGFMTAFPDLVVSMDALRQEGEGFVYHWTLDGTNTGPVGTDRRVHLRGYEEWTIGPDGFIVRSLGHFDEAEYRRQLAESVAE